MNLQQISKSMLEHHVQVAKDRAPTFLYDLGIGAACSPLLSTCFSVFRRLWTWSLRSWHWLAGETSQE